LSHEFRLLVDPDRLDELDGAACGPARGTALERLIEQILTAIPGVKLTRSNALTGQQDASSISFWPTPTIRTDCAIFGTDLLVEASRQDPAECCWRRTPREPRGAARLRWAILISLQGVTAPVKAKSSRPPSVPGRLHPQAVRLSSCLTSQNWPSFDRHGILVEVLEFKRRRLGGRNASERAVLAEAARP